MILVLKEWCDVPGKCGLEPGAGLRAVLVADLYRTSQAGLPLGGQRKVGGEIGQRAVALGGYRKGRIRRHGQKLPYRPPGGFGNVEVKG